MKDCFRLMVRSHFCYGQKEQMLKHLCHACHPLNFFFSVFKDACNISVSSWKLLFFSFLPYFSFWVVVVLGFQNLDHIAWTIGLEAHSWLSNLVSCWRQSGHHIFLWLYKTSFLKLIFALLLLLDMVPDFQYCGWWELATNFWYKFLLYWLDLFVLI